MLIQMEPVAYVQGGRTDPAADDYWGGQLSRIVLSDKYRPEALEGIEEFSHAEIIFFFDRVDPARIVSGTRHPRNNPEWPARGIFAQRGRNRPNRIGVTMCRIIRREQRGLIVAELDAIDGTPVLDIKPVITEFLPRDPVREPQWCRELMRAYWSTKS